MFGTSFQPVLLTMREGPQTCHVGVALISPSQNDPRALESTLLAEVAGVISS
jgi:hypothetical protein